jgi:hypothetical protein
VNCATRKFLRLHDILGGFAQCTVSPLARPYSFSHKQRLQPVVEANEGAPVSDDGINAILVWALKR